jgi:hypothetical protein
MVPWLRQGPGETLGARYAKMATRACASTRAQKARGLNPQLHPVGAPAGMELGLGLGLGPYRFVQAQ